VDSLRPTWVHQDDPDASGHRRWRPAQALPPAGRRLDSPDAPDAPLGNTRRLTWTGDTGQVTEPCEAATRHVMTPVETTATAVTEVRMTEPIPQALHDTQVAPDAQLGAAGSGDAT
jgi:hypothetical protein